jgi:hypothetical protein
MAMIARDQYGTTFTLPGKHPRKELLAATGRTHAARMYIDKKDGTYHTGYVVGNSWFTLYTRWEKKT